MLGESQPMRHDVLCGPSTALPLLCAASAAKTGVMSCSPRLKVDNGPRTTYSKLWKSCSQSSLAFNALSRTSELELQPPLRIRASEVVEVQRAP